MNEYTNRLEKIEARVSDPNIPGAAQDILVDLIEILHEMSDDIESLRNKAHSHEYDNYP